MIANRHVKMEGTQGLWGRGRRREGGGGGEREEWERGTKKKEKNNSGQCKLFPYHYTQQHMHRIKSANNKFHVQ